MVLVGWLGWVGWYRGAGGCILMVLGQVDVWIATMNAMQSLPVYIPIHDPNVKNTNAMQRNAIPNMPKSSSYTMEVHTYNPSPKIRLFTNPRLINNLLNPPQHPPRLHIIRLNRNTESGSIARETSSGFESELNAVANTVADGFAVFKRDVVCFFV